MGSWVVEILLAVGLGATLGWLVAYWRGRRERSEPAGRLVGSAMDWRRESAPPRQTAPRLQTDLRAVLDLLQALGDGALLLDAQQTVLAANGWASQLLSMPMTALVGRKLWELVPHTPLLDALEHVQLGATVTAEIVFHHPRERIVRVYALGQRWTSWFQTDSAPAASLARDFTPGPGWVGAAPAEESGLWVILRDITEWRRLEQYRREFLGNVSHELKTPLAAVQAAAETLQTIDWGDTQAAQRFLQYILDNTARLNRLVQDMLQLARIEAGQQRWHKEAVCVQEVVREVLQRHQARADQKGLQLVLEATSAPLFAWVDAEALTRILENLLDNAIKYTHRGSVTVRCHQADHQVVVEVADTGEGIEPEHLPRIFERFYRVDKARSREQGGSGLGLAIVKHLVQAMAGTIEVHSQPGVGTRFTLRLPVAEQGS